MSDIKMELKSEDVIGDEGPQEDYINVINAKIMKGRKGNEICRTNISSQRSKVVKDLSLEDVIEQRKILKIPKKTHQKEEFSLDYSPYNLNLSLDQIIQSKCQGNKIRSNINRSLDHIIKDEEKSSKQAVDTVDEEMEDEEGEDGGSDDMPSYGRKRKHDGLMEYQNDPYVLSPLELVTKLSQDGLVIEQEIGKQENDGIHRYVHARKWHVNYKCGNISVQCESQRKILARQGAALELINRMRQENSHPDLPYCEIPEACYYDPVICEDLVGLVKDMGMEEPRFEIVQTRNCNRDYFTTTYYIHEDEFIGKSYKIDESKVLAAKGAYQTYSGKPVKKLNFFIGDNCKSYPTYFYRETEAAHNVSLNKEIASIEDMGLDQQNPMIADMLKFEENLMEEELLVDDDGCMYVRAGDGSNKIRRVNTVTMQSLIETKMQKMLAVSSESDDEP